MQPTEAPASEPDESGSDTLLINRPEPEPSDELDDPSDGTRNSDGAPNAATASATDGSGSGGVADRDLRGFALEWIQSLPAAILYVAVSWYFWRFANLVVDRHNDFGSFDYDLGIYDQGIWLLGRGRQFLTVRGLRFLGHHWNPATVLFVPFYKLGAGPNLLNIAQAFAVSVAAIPTFHATKKITRSAWIGLLVALAYLLHASSGWLIQELFHPETMAIPFVLGAWCAAEHEKWRWYAAMVIGALLWKEDVALAVAFLGLVVVWRKDRKIALMTFVGSLAYFFVATKVIIPRILGRSAFYEELFGELGSSMSDLAKTTITHPSKVARVLKEHQAETYAHSILRPFGYISLLSPSSLLIGLPQYFANLLNTLGFIWDPRYHYIAMPLASATVGAGRAIARARDKWQKWGLVLVMVLFTIGTRHRGIGPWSSQFDNGFWPLLGNADSPNYRRALQFVPDDPDVVTSSPYFFTPHLTHRYEAYTFPNPWRPANWAVNGENPRDARRVDYVIMNETVLGQPDKDIYDSQIVRSGDFAEVYRNGTVVVWRRIRNGLKRPAAPPPAQQVSITSTIAAVTVPVATLPAPAPTLPAPAPTLPAPAPTVSVPSDAVPSAAVPASGVAPTNGVVVPPTG